MVQKQEFMNLMEAVFRLYHDKKPELSDEEIWAEVKDALKEAGITNQ